MNHRSSTRIGILNYPGAQLSAILGLIDLLEMANQLAFDTQQNTQSLSVQRIDHLDDQIFSVLILPPSLKGQPNSRSMAGVDDWLMDRHRTGALLCSICAGAFLLADTHLLDGRPATTHWGLAEQFSKQYPKVRVNADKLVIDDGDIITAGGIMAWVNLGLKLVERFLSPSIMLATARFFVVDPGAREQRFYNIFSPSLDHGDYKILGVQHWLQAHSGESISVPDLAVLAGLGHRTFLRRFVKATSLTPSEYLQHLRVGKSRELMELSKSSVDEIAWQVGYQDASAFRRIFQKIMGLTPREYRNRFSAQ